MFDGASVINEALMLGGFESQVGVFESEGRVCDGGSIDGIGGSADGDELLMGLWDKFENDAIRNGAEAGGIVVVFPDGGDGKSGNIIRGVRIA